MNDELELLKIIATRLKSARIEYMMTGSMAMALYSTPRMTRDIDIIIQLGMADVRKIIELFRNDFYIDEQSVRQAVIDRGIFNIIHNDSVIKVDFIVLKNEEYRIEEFSRRLVVDVDGVSICAVTPEDLVLSKLVWAKSSESDLQIRDVRQLLKASANINKDYIEKWSKMLGVYELLKKVASE
jgi:hypothetical protein